MAPLYTFRLGFYAAVSLHVVYRTANPNILVLTPDVNFLKIALCFLPFPLLFSG